MPIKAESAYTAIRELFHVYAEKRDGLETLNRVTEDIFWLGTGQGEKAFGKKELGELLQRELLLDPTPFLITFRDIQGQSISETAMVGTFWVRAVMQNESKISMDIRGSFSCVDTAEGIKVSSIHTSVPTFLQEEGEFFPVSYGEERLKEALEKATKKLRRSEQRYRMAAENMDDLYIWEYDIKTKKCIKQEKTKGTLQVWRNVPESIIEKGVIHPESVAAYRGLHEAVAAGEKEVEAEIVYLNENHRREWYHLKYVTIFDENGTPLRGIGCGRNMTEQKLMEVRFNEEMAYREQMDRENLAASLRVNLSRNRIEAFSKNYAFQEEDLVFTKALEKLAENVPNAEEKTNFIQNFSRENLLKSYMEGQTQLCLEYRRMQSNGKIEWVKTDIKLFQKPYSDDVIGFSYMENIHEKKLTRSIVDSAIAGDYDYIACINRMDTSYVTYVNGTSGAILPPPRGANFILGVEEYVRRCVLEEDRERVLAAKDLNHIISQLEKNNSYDSYYRAFQQDGTIARKKLRFSYLNGEKGLVVLSQTDVTHVFEENQRKNEILGEALQAAQQANAAKTDFLSRMSHEIRTPMNAIIGMSAIAAQNMEDKEQVADCIGKIGISSRFLLSLINDILDMSRIESGKVLLKKEKISFGEFMGGINDICYSQAVTKNIDYECMVYPCVEDCYIGDTMKLQQVLINVLSNAVKFTPNGGKVSLSVRQMQKTKTDAILRFTIQDTGCGISENFLPKLFQPFSQEHSGITSAYGGTGLGLAICKNLVSFMDGKINVSSTLGEGSTFLIQVKLGIPEEPKQNNPANGSHSFENRKVLVVDDNVSATRYTDFTGKRVLLVEDHPLNVEVARKLLEHKGFQVEHAENGLSAIEQFSAMPVHYYDVILMDIRMPVMDGLQAAKKIRLFQKEDAKTIPIIAMTANAFEDDIEKSKEAGMNAHLAKPIEPKRLFQTLSDFLEKE